MEKEYLTKEHLIGFDNYKYSSVDTGILSIYVMHPFWNWLVQFFPKSIAPNVITFTGFLFTVSSYLLFAFLDYSFYAADPAHAEVDPIPNWMFAAVGISLFTAYTLDGVDGKQARRIGLSGPLGELFDHGLDSWTVGMIPLTMYSIFGRGQEYSIPPFRMYFLLWNVIMNFYYSHFEKYNTGVLFLPWGYDFSMWGTILTFIATGFGGHEMWRFKVGPVTSGNIVEFVLVICSLVTNVPVVAYNIYLSYKNKTGHMRPFMEAIRPLISVFLSFMILLVWIVYSPSNIVERDPRALFFLMTTIFSNISCRLIVAQMSNTRCEIFNALLYPTSFVAIVSIFLKWGTVELLLLHALNIFATLAHIHYGTCVVRQMCRHFRRKCFSVKKPSD